MKWWLRNSLALNCVENKFVHPYLYMDDYLCCLF
jgi:hypothetical protein